jgi:hypothetical protein
MATVNFGQEKFFAPMKKTRMSINVETLFSGWCGACAFRLTPEFKKIKSREDLIKNYEKQCDESN